MNQPTDPDSSITAPTGPRPDDRLGGIASNATGGVSEHLERSFERGHDPATGHASTGNATGGQSPRSDLGGKNEPGAAPGGGGAASAEATPQQATPGTSGAAGGGVETDTPAEGMSANATGVAGTSRTEAGTAAGAGGAGTATPTAGRPPASQAGEVGSDGLLDSLGKAVSGVVTGSVDTAGTEPGARERH